MAIDPHVDRQRTDAGSLPAGFPEGLRGLLPVVNVVAAGLLLPIFNRLLEQIPS